MGKLSTSIRISTRAIPAMGDAPAIESREVIASPRARKGREGKWWKFQLDGDVFVAPCDLSDVKATLKRSAEKLLISRQWEAVLNGPASLPRL